MGPTEAEGDPLVAEAPGHAATAAEDPFASFLQTVQAMVQEGPAEPVAERTATPEGASRRTRRAARRAAKAARRHEDKLARAERKSARRSRSHPRQLESEILATVEVEMPPVLAEPAEPEQPAATSPGPQRVPAQAVEPVLDETSAGVVGDPAGQGSATAGRRAGRRRRSQQEAREATVPSGDPEGTVEAPGEPSEVPVEELSEVAADVGLGGIRFTAADPAPVRRSRGARRLDRRRDAARAVAASVPTAELVEPTGVPAQEPVGQVDGAVEPPAGPDSGPDAGRGSGPEPPAGSVPPRGHGEAPRESEAPAGPDGASNLGEPEEMQPGDVPADPAVPDRRERRRQKREEKARGKARRAEARADAVAAVKAQKAQANVDRIQAQVESARAKAEARAAREAAKPDRPGDRDDPTLPWTDADPGPSAPAGRRERREEQALARKVAKAARLGASADRPAEAEDLAGYVARVQSPRLPRRTRRSRARTPLWFRRTVKISAVVVLVAACATLPWVAPQVPDVIAGVLPGHGTTAVRVADPPVAPPKDALVGPVGVGQLSGPYDGVRLQSAGSPRQVEVKRLHVDSQVVPISGQSGSLVPPPDPQVLGWWKEGQPVGARYGTAVITGHTVHTGGGALDHLDQLVVGDSVRVRTDAGWIRYVVQRTQIYSTDRLAREAKDVFRLGGTGRLVLITCDDWDGKRYLSNAVVVATPVLDEPFAS